jgi:citrate/tricarballylate utilization protein
MQQLEYLIEDARKAMTICNACRYCEGFCAVFPAMEKRLVFAQGDIDYLANLCHNCGECYYSCQYAPPHEFAVNVPQSLAKVRAATYRLYAWPGPLAALFDRNGLVASLALALGLILVLLAAIALVGGTGPLTAVQPDGNFYALIPHNVLAVAFGAVSLFVVLALFMGFMNFWRDVGEQPAELGRAGAWKEAWSDALQLRYLHGQGEIGCTYPDDVQSLWRRRWHHFTFYGFMLCFAATVTGTVYHYVFGWEAPYAFASLPKLFGITGGISLMIGTAGLLYLKLKRDPNTADVKQTGMDVAFIVQLWLAAATGLLLMLVRDTPWLGVMLVIHLGIIMGLFLTLPFGKFVHGLYRLGALVKYSLEKRRPNLNIAGE